MKRLIDLSSEEARAHFLKGSSYFNGDLPKYISFEPILTAVSAVLNGANYAQFKNANPNEFPNVNYNFIANKDGKFAWRPYELLHPVIYVSLVNVICETENWACIRTRIKEFEGGVVDCCSAPVMSVDHQTDVATQIKNWWQSVEQRSLTYSLEFSHLLHTDVTDCYGSLYTHSIAWAMHGLTKAKEEKTNKSLLGNKIDSHIQASRYGQTNGIAQGSVLMDFIAEIVLGYVDEQINLELAGISDIRILRYRDDYRIFANSDERSEAVLKIVSDKLRAVGMRLGVSKTISCRNIVEGSIKPDKLAGIEQQDLGTSNRVLKISASPSVFQRPGKNYAGANPSRSVSMTIRTVFPADGARVIERRGRRSKYHLFNNDFRNARAAMAPLNHDASKLPSRVRL